MGFSRQGYWSGLPFPSPEDLPDPGIEPGSPTLQADALPSEPPGNKIANPGSIQDIGCLGLVHWDDPEIEPGSPTLPSDALPSEPPGC